MCFNWIISRMCKPVWGWLDVACFTRQIIVENGGFFLFDWRWRVNLSVFGILMYGISFRKTEDGNTYAITIVGPHFALWRVAGLSCISCNAETELLVKFDGGSTFELIKLPYFPCRPGKNASAVVFKEEMLNYRLDCGHLVVWAVVCMSRPSYQSELEYGHGV